MSHRLYPLPRPFRTAALAALLLAACLPLAAQQPVPAAKDAKINIFAVLSPEIEAAAKACSQDLFDQEHLSTFPQQGFQIHCTLYMTNYPPAAVDHLKGLAASFAATVKPFPATTTGMSITKDNWFFLNVERDRNLQTLCDEVVRLASPLRSPTSFIPDWAKDNPEKVEYIKKYGSPNVFAQFEPHLTLLAKADGAALQRFAARNAQNPAYAPPIAGRVVGIGLGVADRNGQIATPTAVFLFPAD